jgi:hypothetical protein
MNKLSLVGMQLPEKYKENFDVSSEGPSSGRALIAQNVKILHRLKNIEPQGPVTLLRMRETYEKRMKINAIIFIRTKIL